MNTTGGPAGPGKFVDTLYYYYIRTLLETLENELVLYQLGKKVKLPKHMGKEVKWMRYSKVAGSTSALTEGTPPSETELEASNVTASISQYGQFTKISDLLSWVHISPIMEDAMKRFGFAAADTIEDLIRNEIQSNAAILYVGADADPTEDEVVAGDVLGHKNLIEAMMKQKVARIKKHESGAYVAVLHPACQYDLLIDDAVGAWLDVNKRTSSEVKKVLKGEFGQFYGMRLLSSDRMQNPTNGGGVEVKRNFVFGAESLGVVEIDSKSVRMITKAHGSGGTSDPLDQFATVGYKIMGFVPKFLGTDDDKRIIQLRCASALS